MYCRAHLAQLREAYPQFREERAEIVVVGPDPVPAWNLVWPRAGLLGVPVPDPSRRVAALYRQERRLMFWLPAVFIIDRRGRLRYARYGATLRDAPLSATLVAELARINRPGPEPAAMPAIAPERRQVLAAGAAAFVGRMRATWSEALSSGRTLGATADEWLAALLAEVAGEVAGQLAAEGLLAGAWLAPDAVLEAENASRCALAALTEAEGVQDRMVLLVRLLEMKDPYTAGHSERVGALASAIGLRRGLSPDEVEDLAVAGLLHDVGKVVVPRHVLHKPGRLNADEFAVMRLHPAAGEELIGLFTSLGRLCPAVRHHHESWGGGGYPDGIAGEQIPLGGRVLAACDAYDAMTSARPYRDAMDRAQALAIMERDARGQWEPAIVADLRAVVDTVAESDAPVRAVPS